MRKTSSLPNSIADSTDYPFGGIQDETNNQSGTPVVEATYSDFIQNLWRFFTKTGTTPNGLIDNSSNGFQLFNAMQKFFMPIGIVQIFTAISSIPDGWLKCDGQSLSTTTYSDLFALIGYTYGGSGSNFNIPNMTGKFPIGYGAVYGGTTIGSFGGEPQHTLTVDELPQHAHNILGITGGDNNDNNNTTRFAGGDKSQGDTSFFFTNTIACQNTGGGHAHSNMPPYMAFNFIIKAKYV